MKSIRRRKSTKKSKRKSIRRKKYLDLGKHDDYMSSLPSDILSSHIYSFLDKTDMSNLGTVNKTLNKDYNEHYSEKLRKLSRSASQRYVEDEDYRDRINENYHNISLYLSNKSNVNLSRISSLIDG